MRKGDANGKRLNTYKCKKKLLSYLCLVQRVAAIFLFLVFGVYSFTFKTHYCYYAGTNIRFHGDCKHELKEADAKGNLSGKNFFPKHYECVDIVKDALPEQPKIITIKNDFAGAFVFQPELEVEIPQEQNVDWLIPEFHCRSATLLRSNSLRAPPSC